MFVGIGVGVGRQRVSGGAFVGLLDLYPSASVAYSLRKLSSTYTGNAIRVRRASDNTEQNIGFDALGNLDTTALTAFCSGTNGFVTTWYDQSGNGNNAVQTTASSQPQIISSGSVITRYGKPTITYDGSNDFMLLTSARLLNSDFSAYYLQATGQGTGFGTLGDSGSNYRLTGVTITSNPDLTEIETSSGQTQFGVGLTERTDGLVVFNRASNAVNVWFNAETSTNNPSTNSGSINFNQLMRRSTFRYTSGGLQEVVVYLSNQASNQANIRNNINTYYAIY